MDTDLDKFDHMPKQASMHNLDRDDWDYYGSKLPYSKFMRWLKAQKGTHLDVVIHKYNNLEWLPPYLRTLRTLYRWLEVHTFLQGNEVYYYSYGKPRLLSSEQHKIIYVHPETKLICVFSPVTRKSWQKLEQERRALYMRTLGELHQLNKANGIWYEVKAKFIPEPEFAKDLDKLYAWMKQYGYKLKGPKDILLEPTEQKSFNHKRSIIEISSKRQLNSKELKHYQLHNN